jgi:hypothetical protein
MKKLLSKFFRVATEGATIDGREITGKQIEEMAKNYSPKKYGARIWLEHLRSLLAEGLFAALGDVVALKVGTNEEGKKVLLAQLAPLPTLINMNKDGQKVFSSIEMDTSFADTGEAYMVGLAVTDTPASTGTEMLAFSLKNPTQFADSDAIQTHLFSEYIEIEGLEYDEVEDPKDKPTLLSKVKGLLNKEKGESAARFNDVDAAVTVIAESQDQVQTELNEAREAITELTASIAEVKTKLADTIDKLTKKPGVDYKKRPVSTGSDAEQVADC